MTSIAKCTQYIATLPAPRTDERAAAPNTNPAAQKKQVQAAKQPSSSEVTKQPASCSDITGTGSGASVPGNCATPGGALPNVQSQTDQPRPGMNAPPPPRVVMLPPPQCNMCDVLKTVGEVVPELVEKLNNLKLETINDAEPPLFDGGPNTLRPYLPRRALASVTTPQDPLDAINDMKDIASSAKALGDLMDKNKEPEDYADKCRDGFLDASWQAFTAKDGSYAEKAKAARDSLKECWKAAARHIEDTITSGGVVSDRSSGDK